MKRTVLLLSALLVVASGASAAWVSNNPGVDVAWTSSFNAGWGCAAARSNPATGGAVDSGAYFSMERSCGQGSSAEVMVVPVNPGSGTISGYMRRASVNDTHWTELAYADGTGTAQQFDEGGGPAFTLINKFDGFGLPTGNGGVWTNYPVAAAISASTVTLGVKAGCSGTAPSTANDWDLFQISDPLEAEDWMLY